MSPLAAPGKNPDHGLMRGACPTLAVPMKTGDGLLARLRPLDCTLSAAQLKVLAEAAIHFGNGIIEITARGSLQIRGLRADSVRQLEEAVFAAGIDIPPGVTIETSPLAGLDPTEITDVRPLAARLREAIAANHPSLGLAPKFTVIVDGGGYFQIGNQSADLRVTAVPGPGETRYLLAVGGTNATANRIAVLPQKLVPGKVMDILARIAEKGPTARGRDLSRLDLDSLTPPADGLENCTVQTVRPTLTGLLPLKPSHKFAVGLVLPYNQATSDMLISLSEFASQADAGEIRLAPDHGLLITGLSEKRARHLQLRAADIGFLTEADDPRRNIALCAGSRGCASGFCDTRAMAAAILDQASPLLDGSFTLHLSGCAKGCAHPASATLALVGSPTGYGLVVNGAASQAPSQYIAAKDLNSAFGRLASAVAAAKEADETVRGSLERLGAGKISALLQLDLK